ncbi:MAG TPA: VIT domain-containing protein [Planctomycetota bacterium]
MKPFLSIAWFLLGLLALALGFAACQPGNQSLPGSRDSRFRELAGGIGRSAGNKADNETGTGQLPPCRPGVDELWIFAEGPRGALNPADRDGPGTGDMVGRSEGGAVLPLPLQHTAVRASVRGYLSTVDVEQRFLNPYAEKIEAVYVFPLPDDAAVRDFVMVVGERQIRGIIRKKEEARAIYHEARAQGFRASLLEQARPNVFEQSVANLEPGKGIDVRLRYFHTLAYGSDGYEFVFPMVVGPRYNPPGWQQGIGAVPAGAPGTSGQPTEVAYLQPEVRAASEVSLAVDVDAGMPLGAVVSPSHTVEVERQGGSCAKVRLAGGSTIPNRDFVLRFEVAGEGSRASLFTCNDKTGGYLTMLVQPPDELRELPRQPLELVFLLDCSGSMSGAPIAQAKAAAELALQLLGPQDSFQIIRFSESASAFGQAPVPATPANLAAGRQYLASLQSEGGTNMLTGVRAALRLPHDREKLRFVAFLTDGYIGNESEVFTAVREDLGSARIFGLGVGSSVNRYLLEGVARLGRGAVGYLLHDEAPGRAVAQLWERISRPALTDLEIDWGGTRVHEVFPPRLPDLFAGRPIVVTARFDGMAPKSVRLRGRVGSGTAEFDAAVCDAAGEALAALPAVWARRKIQSLSDYAEVEGIEAAPARVEELALSYSLMSAFTSFVAVDASGRTAGEHGTTVQVPVPMPAGVRYSTTVGSK